MRACVFPLSKIFESCENVRECASVDGPWELDSEESGVGAKGEIDLSEWDNLFASGFMDFHSLSRTVKSLGKEQSNFLLDRAKSFKSGLKGYGAV